MELQQQREKQRPSINTPLPPLELSTKLRVFCEALVEKLAGVAETEAGLYRKAYEHAFTMSKDPSAADIVKELRRQAREVTASYEGLLAIVNRCVDLSERFLAGDVSATDEVSQFLDEHTDLLDSSARADISQIRGNALVGNARFEEGRMHSCLYDSYHELARVFRDLVDDTGRIVDDPYGKFKICQYEEHIAICKRRRNQLRLGLQKLRTSSGMSPVEQTKFKQLVATEPSFPRSSCKPPP